jgi:spore maturation protein CgeB
MSKALIDQTFEQPLRGSHSVPANKPEQEALPQRMLLVDTTLYAPASPLFLGAMEESCRDRSFFNEAPYLGPLTKSFTHKIARRLLGRPLTAAALNRDLVNQCREFRPEVVLIVKGAYIRASALAEIKRTTGAKLVNFATDDPFNPANSTQDLLECIPHYDLYVCTKKAIMPDVLRAGAKQVCFVPFGYHPGVHFPELPATPEEKQRFACDVAFIGGADNDRVDIVKALSRVPNITLNLFGGYWSGIPEARKYARGFAVGRDYRLAIAGAKITIGLVRRANRDGHAMRTFEIPACRGFMLAERTREHLDFFREREHVDFFGPSGELVDKVRYYLDRPYERERIAQAGYQAVTSGRHTYQDRLREIVSAVHSTAATNDEMKSLHRGEA